MIRGLLYRQDGAIFDIKLGDTDADTYKYNPMTSLLVRWEKIKKDKHGKHCHDQRNVFSPFVLSVDGILGRENLVVISQPIIVMAEKRGEPLLQVQEWVNRRIAISVLRSYSRMIHRDQLPSPLR